MNKEWDMTALDQVEYWLTHEFIMSHPIGSSFEIGKIARQSGEVAKIQPGGNIEGFKHLVGKLEGKGYVKRTESNNFEIVKKPE